MNKNILKTLAVAAMIAPVGSAFAASSTGTLSVSAEVQDSCTVAAASIAYGVIDPSVTATATIDATTDLSVTCTGGTVYTIGLSGTVGARKMTGTNDPMATLNYELYSDAGHATAWDNTSTIGGTGNFAAQTYPVYSAILTNQEMAAVDSYTDSVTITVSY